MNWQSLPHGPFQGYVSSVNRSKLGPGNVGSGSFDADYSPVEGKFFTRAGSGPLDSSDTSGLCESKFGGRARCIIEFSSSSLSDGYPSYLVVYTNESGKEGYCYFRGNDSVPLNGLGRFFDMANHYPAVDGGDNGLTARTLSAYEHRWMPHWAENSTTPQGRGCTEPQRKVLVAGTRRAVGSGRWIFFPNQQASPGMWDKGFNNSTSSGTNVDRYRPWGLIPPLHLPRMITTNLPTEGTSVNPWKTDDRFFMTVTFVDETGAESKPWVPQGVFGTSARTDEYVDVYGLVTVPGTANNYRAYLRLTQVPVGPVGTVARRLYRTTKTNGSNPVLGSLRLWEVIPDNTTTTYDSYNGDDDSLLLLGVDEVEGTARLFAQGWPKRGKYAWSFDGRVGVGNLKERPEAIILCPTGPGDGSAMSNSRTNNGADDKLITNGHFFIRVYNNGGTKTLQLRYLPAATATPAADASIFNTEITLTAAKTLQDIVNDINTTLCTDNTANTREGGEWAAQLRPGVNPLITADNIDYTTSDNPSGVAYNFGDDDSTIFSGSTGSGNQRAWNNAWPGILYLTQAYVAALDTYPSEFTHTEAGPQLKNVGSYGSPFTFIINGPGWRVKPPEDAGYFVGAWALADGCVVCYSKSIWRYQNRRGGTTGEDFDYRLNKISDKGCIAWASITGGNNWVGWMSRDGYCVTNGDPDSEVIITRAIWNAEEGTGDLSYEVAQSVLGSGADTDLSYLAAEVLGDALYLHYRSSVSTSYPNRTLKYSFAASAANSGLAQVLDDNRNPYGWSTVWTIGYACAAIVRRSGGYSKIGAKDEADSAHSTGTGRVDRFETGTNDPGSAAIVPILYERMEDFSGRRARCRKMRFKHKTPTGSTTTVSLSRDVARATSTNYTLATTGSDAFGYETKRVKLAQQTPSRVYEVKVTNDGLAASAFEWYGSELEVRVLDTGPELD